MEPKHRNMQPSRWYMMISFLRNSKLIWIQHKHSASIIIMMFPFRAAEFYYVEWRFNIARNIHFRTFYFTLNAVQQKHSFTMSFIYQAVIRWVRHREWILAWQNRISIPNRNTKYYKRTLLSTLVSCERVHDTSFLWAECFLSQILDCPKQLALYKATL